MRGGRGGREITAPVYFPVAKIALSPLVIFVITLIRKPAVQIVFLIVASLAIYLALFLRPYSLFDWWTKPGMTIAKIDNWQPAAGAVFVLAMLALFLFYWLASRIVLRFYDRRIWVLVLVGALAFNLTLMFMYTVDSTDLFDNILRGRMTALYGQNVFYDKPSSAAISRNDPFFRYTGWPNITTAYGPWWEMTSAAIARAAGDGIVANVLAYKAAMVLLYALTGTLIALTLREHAPRRTLYGVLLWTWNPLALYSIAGNAHNDALMVLFLVLGFFFLARGNLTLAALAETGGALCKFVPAVIVPVILLAGLQRQRDWIGRVKFLAVTGVLCALLVAVSYAPFYRGGDILNADWRSHMFTTSIPTLVKTQLDAPLTPKVADSYIDRITVLVTGVWVLLQLVLLWRARRANNQWTHYVRAALAILLFYNLVTGLWFQPWYTLWTMALAALLPDSMIARGSILFTLAASFKMPVFDFLIGVRPGHIPPVDVREWQVTPATLGLVWIYFIYQSLKAVPPAVQRLGARVTARDATYSS